MQDKYQQKKYADRGWKRMKEILDREMPAAEGKHRYPFLLWIAGAAGVILLFIGGMYLMRNGDHDAGPGEIFASNPPIAAEPGIIKTEKPPVKDGPGATMANDGLEQSPSQAEATSSKHDEGGVPAHVASGNRLASSLKVSADLSRPGNTGGGTVFHSSEEEKQPGTEDLRDIGTAATPAGHSAAGKHIETETVILPQHSDLARNRDFLLPLHKKMRIQYEPAFNDFPSPGVIAVAARIRQVHSSDRKLHFALGLRASINTVGEGMSGFGGGPELRWQLSRRVALFSGVQYEKLQKGGFLDFAQQEDASLSLTPITVVNDPSGGAVTAVSMDVDAESVESLTNSFSYLHVPAGIEYFAGKGFSIQVGARYSRLLGAPSREKIALVDAGQQQSFNQLDGISRNSLFTNDFVAKNDVSMLVGANLYIWRKLVFHVEYNHGLLGIFRGGDNTTTASRNRTVSLGLRYHFSKA